MKRIFSAVMAAVVMFVMLAVDTTAYAEDIRDVSAKSAVVIDAADGEIIFRKNAFEKLPIASITKIMTVLLTLEHGDIDKYFTVDSNAIKVEGSSMGLREGDKVTLRTLCYGMMLPSGNDAAGCAAVKVGGSVKGFVAMMNKRAAKIGMKNTHFVTPSGLDDNTDEHYSTAYDMALLTKEALKNKQFREICGTKSAKLKYGNPPYERWLSNTNKLLRFCDGVFGVKTGFTDKAGRCLVSACRRKNTELICVTLNARNDWSDHSDLYKHCFGYYSQQELPCKYNSFTVDVVGGSKDKVVCSAEKACAVLPNGNSSKVTSEVYLEHFVYAPVKSGDTVGKIVYRYNGRKICEAKIKCCENCDYSEYCSS